MGGAFGCVRRCQSGPVNVCELDVVFAFAKTVELAAVVPTGKTLYALQPHLDLDLGSIVG